MTAIKGYKVNINMQVVENLWSCDTSLKPTLKGLEQRLINADWSWKTKIQWTKICFGIFLFSIDIILLSEKYIPVTNRKELSPSVHDIYAEYFTEQFKTF
jgi:hypothetical protein